MLGELNWVFTAITDTIAWNILPRGIIKNMNSVMYDYLKKKFFFRYFSNIISTRFISCESTEKFLVSRAYYANL